MPAVSTPSARAPGRRRLAVRLGLLLAFGLFGAGLVELFQLRFETGDVYPAYSTLRSDPLGAAAFYEALASQPGVEVERNLRPLSKLDQKTALRLGGQRPRTGREADPPTCFFLGADPYQWPTDVETAGVERLEEILRAGGRVVMTFKAGAIPLTTERLEIIRAAEASPSPSPDPSPGTKKRTERERLRLEERGSPDLAARWGIDFRRVKVKWNFPGWPAPSPKTDASGPPATSSDGPQSKVALAPGQTAVPVPGGELAEAGDAPWHTALDFEVETPEAKAAGWRAWYVRDGKPVIVARPYGTRGGELILASDSYFLSNEALRAEPRPGLLAGLVGNGRRLIFDESHHGVQENPGLMTLARRYGLQRGLAAVALLVGLFIWRNVQSLVPPAPNTADNLATAATVTGRDSAAGFLNLVRRGVPPDALIATCLAQWQSDPGGRGREEGVAERLRAAADEEGAGQGRRRTPAGVYRAMCAAVRRRD